MWVALSILAAVAVIVLVYGLLRRRGAFRGYATASVREHAGATGAEPDFSEFPCGHDRVGDADRPPKVFGIDVFVRHEKLCSRCLEAYLNTYATRCAACGDPILPGEPVGQAWVGAPHPHTHLTFDCSETGGLYCGRWGQGRLITLHEIAPEKYPEGTTTVMSHAFRSGGVIIENDMK